MKENIYTVSTHLLKKHPQNQKKKPFIIYPNKKNEYKSRFLQAYLGDATITSNKYTTTKENQMNMFNLLSNCKLNVKFQK